MICNSCVFFAVGQMVILYRELSWLFEATEIKNGIVKLSCAVRIEITWNTFQADLKKFNADLKREMKELKNLEKIRLRNPADRQSIVSFTHADLTLVNGQFYFIFIVLTLINSHHIIHYETPTGQPNVLNFQRYEIWLNVKVLKGIDWHESEYKIHMYVYN